MRRSTVPALRTSYIGSEASLPRLSPRPHLCLPGCGMRRRERLQDAIPESAPLVREADHRGGAPARGTWLNGFRLVPVPSIGTEHTDPSIRRIMLEVPRGMSQSGSTTWRGRSPGLHVCDPQTGGSWNGHLVSTEDARMARAIRARPAREFRSITPVALSGASRRRLEPADTKSAERTQPGRTPSRPGVSFRPFVMRASGPGPTDIRVQREPFRIGEASGPSSSRPVRDSRSMRCGTCRFQFREMIPGPMLIGDGRFCGLGLMEPIRRMLRAATTCSSSGSMGNSQSRQANRPALVRSLRRALMSLARDDSGGVGRLVLRSRAGRPIGQRGPSRPRVSGGGRRLW